LPERFEILFDHINKDTDLIGSYVAETNQQDEIYAVKKVPLFHEDILIHLKKRNPFNHMSVAFKKSAAISLGGYPHIELREDYGLWAAMISKGYKSKNIENILVHASAGEKMFTRRKGGAVIKAEIALQYHLVNTGVSNYVEAIFYGASRCLILLMPKFIIELVYSKLLRN